MSNRINSEYLYLVAFITEIFNMKKFILLFIFSIFTLYSFAQNMTGAELLEKSIKYHDPKGKWSKVKMTLDLKQETPNRPERTTTSKFNNKKGTFWQKDISDENTVTRSLENDICTHELNGKKTFTEDEIKKHRLECKWTKFWRDYQTYLYGLPMKLKDNGTTVHDKVEKTTFQNQDCWKLKVTYEEPVGHDTWYFYFHPTTYALIGYRFYHEEEKNDGEYITLEDEIIIKGIRLPRDRKWYFNIDNKFLGKDYILSGK